MFRTLNKSINSQSIPERSINENSNRQRNKEKLNLERNSILTIQDRTSCSKLSFQLTKFANDDSHE